MKPSRRRTPRDLAVAASNRALEPLEPRVLLAALAFDPLTEYFNLPGVLHEIAAPEGADAATFGAYAAALGDVDGDGIGDFAVADAGRAASGEDPAVAGRVFIYSGATATLLRSLQGDAPGFGSALAGVGDLNGDDVPDLLVGSPAANGGSGGAAYVLSGADGSVIHALQGAGVEQLGFIVASIADLNGDDVADLLVGAPGAAGVGQVLVLSGATGMVIHVLDGVTAGGRFGAAVAELAASGDGAPGIIVGAPLADGAVAGSGDVSVFDGVSGELRLVINGESAGDEFGAAVAASPAGSGLVVVGLPGDGSGRIALYDAAGELVTREFFDLPGSRFGDRIIKLGDVDRDGVDDLAVTQPGGDEGPRLRIYSGAGLGEDGYFPTARIYSTTDAPAPAPLGPGTAPIDLGPVVFGAGDVDGDGVADLIARGPDGVVRVVSSLAANPPSFVSGGNDDLSFVYASSIGPGGFAFINGVFTPIDRIPGLMAGDYIFGVNAGGMIVAGASGMGGGGGGGGGGVTAMRIVVVSGGVRMELQDAVTQVVGGQTPDYSGFGSAEFSTADGPTIPVGDDGSFVLHDVGPGGTGRQRAWLFKEGVLTFLWFGEAQDVNDSGAVLGTQIDENGDRALLLRDADGTVRAIDGLSPLRTITRVEPMAPLEAVITARLNNAGEVVGMNDGGNLAVWRSGVVTEVVVTDASPGIEHIGWTVRDFADDGRILAVREGLSFGALGAPARISAERLMVPNDAPDFTNVVWGGFGEPTPGFGILLADGGRTLHANGVAIILDPREPWVLAEGSPLATTGRSVYGVNTLGDVFRLSRDGDAWTGERLHPDTLGGNVRGGDITGLHAYTDPTTGEDFVFILGGDFLEWHGPGVFQSVFLGHPGSTAVRDHATIFTASGDRTMLAGLDENGDLVVYFQTGTYEPHIHLNWSYGNISRDHLAPQGLSLPTVASDLTAFTTPWGSDHLAFLDDVGDLHVVWIPPDGTQWTIVNLSDIAGAAPLTGGLTSFVTAWNTIHFNAVDNEGNLTAVWWAPGFGGDWRADPLLPGAAVALDPSSMTGFTTAWGGLNIAGRSLATGEAVTFWWTPETNAWQITPLEIVAEGEETPLVGELAAASEPSTLNVFARDESGGLTRLSWSIGDGATWTLENLTDLAV